MARLLQPGPRKVIVTMRIPQPRVRRLSAGLLAAAVLGAPVVAAAPAYAATTGTLLYSTDGGSTWSANATVAPGSTVLVRQWYNNADATTHDNASVSTTLPAGFNLVVGSTRTCLNPSTAAGSEAAPPKPGELVCNSVTNAPINESAVWSGPNLTISPTAGLFGQSTGATSGIMAMGKKRYINFDYCKWSGATVPGTLDSFTTYIHTTSTSYAWADTNVSNSTTPQSCSPAPTSYTLASGAGQSSVQPLDLMGNRYVNLQTCAYYNQTNFDIGRTTYGIANNTTNPPVICPPGGTGASAYVYQPANSAANSYDLLNYRYLNIHQCAVSTTNSAGARDRDVAFMAMPDNLTINTGTNASNTPEATTLSGPTCGSGGWAPDPTMTGLATFDTLDQTRGAGYVQYAMTAPLACPSSGSSATQTGTVSGTGFAPVASTGSLTVTAANCPLTIVKTSNPASGSLKPGDVVTYTITATNPSSATYTGATFTDNLSGVLDLATLNGAPTANIGTATINGTDLTWTGDILPGATATITYTVTVN